jgi:hypothetical protein
MELNTEKNYYMINMQKILFVARELHKRGYENLHVVPSVSPTGLAWRCKFVTTTNGKNQSLIVSKWISKFIKDKNKEIEIPIKKLTDIFEKENMEFIFKCKNENHEYVDWFYEMLKKLHEGELPYAFSDYFYAKDYWKTSLDNKIEILSNESQYYNE